jgi:hypothetical protein
MTKSSEEVRSAVRERGIFFLLKEVSAEKWCPLLSTGNMDAKEGSKSCGPFRPWVEDGKTFLLCSRRRQT